MIGCWNFIGKKAETKRVADQVRVCLALIIFFCYNRESHASRFKKLCPKLRSSRFPRQFNSSSNFFFSKSLLMIVLKNGSTSCQSWAEKFRKNCLCLHFMVSCCAVCGRGAGVAWLPGPSTASGKRQAREKTTTNFWKHCRRRWFVAEKMDKILFLGSGK